MADSAVDFTAANEERKKRVVSAILNFGWGNYRFHDVAEVAAEVLDELEQDGESDRMEWATDLAEEVMLAARPISPADLSSQNSNG